MKTYRITYKNEFEVEVEAESEEEALKKAKMSESWSLIDDCWDDFLTVEEDIKKDADKYELWYDPEF